jgi:hypothetical protein
MGCNLCRTRATYVNVGCGTQAEPCGRAGEAFGSHTNRGANEAAYAQGDQTFRMRTHCTE